MKTKTKRRVRRVIGQLLPEGLYCREGCMRYAGLGRRSLKQAERSGMVKPKLRGFRFYYKGSELIDWILNGPIE